jgi:integrase
MPKQRLAENKGLPKRWKFQHGAYYYRVPPGIEHLWDGKKMFRLGKTLPEAYKVWAERLGTVEDVKTIAQLLDRYSQQVIPLKKPNTRTGNNVQIGKLRAVFGHMPLNAIEPQHIYKYADKREKKIAARREIALLSHAYTKAVEWGYISKHPFKGEVRLKAEAPRTRYVEDWEIHECFKLKPLPWCRTHLMQASMAFIIVTGLRKQDLLTINVMTDFLDEGIKVNTKKTGQPIIIKWTPALRIVTQQLLDLRPVDISPWLVCTKRGECYYNPETGRTDGWNSIWGRFMDRVLKETGLKDRFTTHDLRAKCASDIENEQDAQRLLAHASISTTRRSYRRAPHKVMPGR